MNDDAKKLKAMGSRIKEMRKRLKITQKEMAKSLGIAGCYLSEIENGRGNPGFKFYFNLSKLYYLSLDYLFHGIGEMFINVKKNISQDKRNFVDEILSVDDLQWFIEHSPLFKHTIMGFATKFHYENEKSIKRNIKKFKSNQEKKNEKN